jgi:hypothetical protein
MRTGIIARAVEAPSFWWLDGGQLGSKTSQDETWFQQIARTRFVRKRPLNSPTHRAAQFAANIARLASEHASA